jgi:hypothetical protein
MRKNEGRIIIFIFIFGLFFNLNLVSAGWSENLNEGLVAYWNFDEGSGNEIIDAIGKNNGTHSAGWANGILNDSGNYTGLADSETIITYTPSIETKSISYAFWMNHRNFGGGVSEWIINKGEGGSEDSFLFFEELGNTNYRCLFIIDGVEGIPPPYNPGVTNQWIFISCIWNGTDVLMYVNGALHSTASLPKSFFTSSYPFVFGTKADNSQNYAGLLDEFGCWNRSLTQEEVSQLYNNGAGITYTKVYDSEYPLFSNLELNTNNNSKYSFGKNYFFNITITSTNGTAGFNFNGTNYTPSNFSFVFNSTISNLAAGIYDYYWWAYGNGTDNLYNTSEIYYYNVAKDEGKILLSIDNISANQSADNQTQVNLTVILENGLGEVRIYVNGSLFGKESNLLQNNSVFNIPGLYNITAIYSGNENFTSDSKTFWLNITEHIFQKSSLKKSSSNGGGGGTREIYFDDLENSFELKKGTPLTRKAIPTNLEETTLIEDSKKPERGLYKTIKNILGEIQRIISNLMAMFK